MLRLAMAGLRRSRTLSTGVAALLALLASGVCSAQAAPRRYALALFHFNVQYVAGGMVGFWPQPDPATDLNAEQIEDAIVVESFEPVLDLYLAHPSWGVDLEMQAYMLDVIGERHPGVLDKLRTLARRGQAEVVSFHYGDQLFLAYPPEDWERSADLVRATFARWDVPLSTTVFCQEGQAGPGLARGMADKGWDTLVWPKNLWSFQHPATPDPIYRLGAVRMIPSQGLHFSAGGDDWDVQWTFLDDGELLATGDVDPYFPAQFKKNPAALSEYEQKLEGLEAQGYAISTVKGYVDALEAAVGEPQPAPALLDGTWQPSSTDGIQRWLGGKGLWGDDERDNDVRTRLALAHRELVAAETLADQAGLDARADLDGAWRLLALGEVSDTTGINPFRGEVEYGLAYAAEVLRVARDVIDRGRAKLGAEQVLIDAAAGTVTPAPMAPAAPEPESQPPLAVTATQGAAALTPTWSRIEDGHWIVRVDFPASDDAADRARAVTFPGQNQRLLYTPALLDEIVSLPRADFSFGDYVLALQNGLVGVGPEPGVYFAIKDQAFVHVGARIVRKSGDVEFADDTAPVGEATSWVFHVVDQRVRDALEVARHLNVKPVVYR